MGNVDLTKTKKKKTKKTKKTKSMFKHPRDKRITFDEPSHVYTVDGTPCLFSVTTFISFWMGKFDRKKIFKKIKSRPKNRQGIYKNMDEKSTFSFWQKAGSDGTKLHNLIEDFFKKGDVFEKKDHYLYKDWEKFVKYHKTKRTEQGWNQKNSDPEHVIFASVPIKNEKVINLLKKLGYNKVFHFGGMIDNLTKKTTVGGSTVYFMEDWKRQRSPFFEDPNKKLPYPFEKHTFSIHMKNSLQLNVYDYILENFYCDKKCFPYKTRKLANVYFHKKYDNVIVREALDLKKEVKIMFDMLKKGTVPGFEEYILDKIEKEETKQKRLLQKDKKEEGKKRKIDVLYTVENEGKKIKKRKLNP
jgi:hypothetical protein